MAAYLGNQKVDVKLGSVARLINFYSTTIWTNGIRLLTDDDYVLKDANGLFITVEKEAE